VTPQGAEGAAGETPPGDEAIGLEALQKALRLAQRQQAFSAAAAAILKARTPQDVYTTAASELIGLGLYAHILKLEPDGQHLSIAHIAFPPSVLRTLITAADPPQRIPLQAVPLCAAALSEGCAQFAPEARPYLEALLGEAVGQARPFVEGQSAILAPLVCQGQPHGLLAVTGPLTPEDGPALATLAGQVSAALENARLYAEAQRRAEHMRLAQEIGSAMALIADLDALLQTVITRMKQAFGYSHVAVGLIEDGHVVFHYAEGVVSRIPLGEGLIGEVAQTGQPALVPLGGQTRDEGRPQRAPSSQTGAELVVPILLGQQPIGVLDVLSDRVGGLDAQDLEIMQALAGQLAAAIQNARLYQQVSRQAEEVSALLASAAVITSSHTLHDRLWTIIKQAVDLVQADGGTIYLLDEDGLTLRPLVALEEYAAEVLATPLRLGEGITGSVARSGVGEIVNDVLSDPRAYQIPGTPRERECLVSVPLAVQGKVIGVMSLVRKGGRGFVPHDLELLTSLAHHAAIAIKNAQLFEEARHRAEQLHALYSVAATAGRSLELNEMLDAVLAEVLRVTGLEVAFIHLIDDNKYLQATPPLRLAAQRGSTKLALHGARLHLDEGILKHAAATGKVTMGSVGLADEAVIIAVPFWAKGRLLGVLSVGGPGRDYATNDIAGAEQVHLLGAMAQQVAGAIENAQLVQALRQRAESLERAYAELAEADRLKDELIQNISHELRTPLTFVKGYADLLANGDLGPLLPEQAEAVQMIVQKANVLVRLVSDIISLHAVSPSTLVPQQINLTDLAESIIARLDPQKLLAEAGIALRCDFAPNVPPVRADPDRMAQVLENLLSNAIKFSPDGGQITVRIWPEDGLVYTAVSDTGIGIPPDKLARIFERFYQVDGSTTRRFGGAGLGLTLCKQIVEAHGGQIYVESELGKGTTFWFTLMAAA
jgi:signal transduction histidine kinase/putative methionine-R-sulfoxide reductase with GAF domain